MLLECNGMDGSISSLDRACQGYNVLMANDLSDVLIQVIVDFLNSEHLRRLARNENLC